MDIFFVISGFLISKIIHSKIQKNTFSLLGFYIDRIKRIVPAYYCMLIICWLLFLFVFVPSDLGKYKLGYFWTFLFNSNHHFANVDDYFGALSNENPLLHTWTLAVEMQFYLFLPLILLVIRNLRTLLITLYITSIIIIGWSTMEIYNANKASMYFSLVSRSSEFFIGVIAAFSKIENKSWVKNHSNYLSGFGLLILIVSAIVFNEASPFPGILALVVCIGAVLILISQDSKINHYISNKYLSYLGEISYSVYLWHWPIMAFYRYYTQSYEFSFIEIVSILLATMIASLLSYYLIERPLRSKERLRFYLPFSFMIVLNVLMVFFTSQVKLRVSNIPSIYIFPSFGLNSHAGGFKEVEVYGGKNEIGKRILFVGDSHALTLKPFVDTIGKKNGFSFRTLTNNVYPTIPFIDPSSIEDKGRRKIQEKLNPIISREFKMADIIIISFYSKEADRWAVAVNKMINNLKPNQRVLLLSDYPTLDKNPVRSNKDFIKDQSRNIKYTIQFNQMPPSILNNFSARENVKFVDFSKNKSFFNDAPFHNDTLMYYDNAHLNVFGSLKYAEKNELKFMEGLNWAIK
ncbi:acyltransferase family protein [Elizabethkingia argentiflava]|uniref:Acyltransferase family protein n=1 Tax=Elizabethkingia argenteiflava TaxID=2681556 RepID=A0A845PZ75_9FLAO|nr:acyltransferase family protein [Elizabethkingia argenteiflava]